MSDETRGPENEPQSRPSCAADKARARAGRRRSAGLVGVLAAVGAVVLSSSCFWLPVLLVAGGASAAGMAGAVDAVRIPAMLVTGALLGAGFYLLYIRKPAGCTPAQQRARKVSRVALWGGAAIAVAFLAFPDQVARVLPSSQARAASLDEGEPGVRSYKLDGMKSPGCVGVAERILADVPNVGSTAIYYEDGKIKLKPREGAEIKDEDVLQAFSDTPFEASPL